MTDLCVYVLFGSAAGAGIGAAIWVLAKITG